MSWDSDQQATAATAHRQGDSSFSRSRRPDLLGWLLLLATLTAVLYGSMLNGWVLRPAHLYVSPSGSNWSLGTSPASPLRTIQSALDRVATSGIVEILPGTYRERLHARRGGDSAKPLTLRARTPGSVRVVWDAPPETIVALQWTQSGRFYSAKTPWPVYRMSVGDETLYHAWNLEHLQRLTKHPRSWGAFFSTDELVTVYLRNGANPQQAELRFNGPSPGPREWGVHRSACLWVEADHVVVEGIHFDHGIGAGINVWSGEDVTIRDCAFTESNFGIIAGQGAKPARNVVVDRCLYHNYPQFEWRREWLDWKECYSRYSDSTLCMALDEGTRITNCLAVQCGDALRVSTRPDRGTADVQVRHNAVVFATDDAIELDGPAAGVTFEENLIYHVHAGFSPTPVNRGPCVLRRNLCINQIAADTNVLVKLSTSVGWPNRVIRNTLIEENLCLGDWLAYWGDDAVEDFRVVGNVFLCRNRLDPPWLPNTASVDNTIVSVSPASKEPTLLEACDELRKAAEGKPWAGTLIEDRLMDSYGPVWWDWENHPATARIPKMNHD